MKSKMAIAALFSVAAILTPAHASTVLFNTSSLGTNTALPSPYSITLSNSGGTITAYGFDGVFSASTPPTDVAGSATGPTTGTGKDVAVTQPAGLGVDNGTGGTNSDIGPGDAVVLDFSGVSSTVKQNTTQVTFDMTVDQTGPSYWAVYGFNGTQYVLLGQGPMETPTSGTGGNGLTGTYSASPTFSTSTLYTSYLVGVTNDCDLTVNEVQITYNGQTTQSTPEPGTFVMAGMALVAVGITMRKRNRKA